MKRRSYRKISPLLGVALLMLAGVAQHSLAVDPPPWYVLRASPEEQAEYLKQVGSDSERLRAQVAKRRFEEKQRHLSDVAAGLRNELEAQRQLMSAQLAAAGAVDATANTRPIELFASSGATALRRGGTGVLLIIALFLLYRYRTVFFGVDPVTKAHRRAMKAAHAEKILARRKN